MSCSQPYADELQALGYRMTPQRHAILHILKASGGHLSPAQVYQLAHSTVPGMTETTVYRTLEFLAENGIVQSRLVNGGHLVYEIAEADHHHLVCRECGAEVEIAHSCLQPFFTELEMASGFKVIGSPLTFFGLCPDCQKD
ncbi:MAG TPA: Fur family transcriptional regulator [Anaerolineales bacterium]|nr:Fur family transcriptional regulator [Anaerolineales bacterium]